MLNHSESDFYVSVFIKKLSKYYTCKKCEDEANRKGHLTKLHEPVHVLNRSLSDFNVSMYFDTE